MNPGAQLRRGFEQMVKLMGDQVICYRNHDSSEQESFEVRGLKNNRKGRPKEVIFQFLEDPGLVAGNVLQQKGARELWRITQIHDKVVSGVYLNFEVEVESVSAPEARRPESAGNVVVHGHVYGGVQVGSPSATQTNIVQAGIPASLVELKELFNRSTLGDLDKEEVTFALSRLGDLSAKPKSPELLAKVSEKIAYLKNIANGIGVLGTTALPLLEKLHQLIAK